VVDVLERARLVIGGVDARTASARTLRHGRLIC